MEKSDTKATAPLTSTDTASMTSEYINAHEPIYSYLISYFLPDLSDPCFSQNAAQEIDRTNT